MYVYMLACTSTYFKRTVSYLFQDKTNSWTPMGIDARLW